MRCFKESGRKRLPHLPPLEFHNQSIIIYVTQVVAGRRHLLDRAEVVENVLNAWKKADHWLVGRYVIMPDHIHFFCAPATFPYTPLKSWMAFWRADATRNWPWPIEKPIWQRDFFDRQLRRRESHSEKWQYMRQNPVRAGLVPSAEEWPWQGEQNALMWHDAD